MSRKSLLDRYEPFVAAAIIGAHANAHINGFRQYDVRFMIEIFTNWAASGEEGATLFVQNTQVARYIQELVNDGLARKTQRGDGPRYLLTRTGLIDLATRLVSKEYYSTREHFFFVYFVVSAYRRRILKMIEQEGKRFPYSMQLELETLLDPIKLLDRQIQFAQRELAALQRRINDTMRVVKFVASQPQDKLRYHQILERIDRELPFAINPQSRMAEVFAMGTERQGLWELSLGNRHRIQNLWEPTRNLLAGYIAELKRLRELEIKKATTVN